MMNGVLVLCDDLIFTSKVTATGRAAGLAVAVARTAEAAVRRAAAEPPACVLLDLHNDGLDLTRLLTELRAGCPTMPRVIGFGSHVNKELLDAARLAGCDLVMPRSLFRKLLEGSLVEWATPATS